MGCDGPVWPQSTTNVSYIREKAWFSQIGLRQKTESIATASGKQEVQQEIMPLKHHLLLSSTLVMRMGERRWAIPSGTISVIAGRAEFRGMRGDVVDGGVDHGALWFRELATDFRLRASASVYPDCD